MSVRPVKWRLVRMRIGDADVIAFWTGFGWRRIDGTHIGRRAYAYPWTALTPAEDRAERVAYMLSAQRGLCALCRRPLGEDDITIDHKVPRSKRGSDSPRNQQLAHKRCNGARGSTSLPAWHRRNKTYADTAQGKE